MTNGDWIRTLDDAKANELLGGWIPCEDWGGGTRRTHNR